MRRSTANLARLALRARTSTTGSTTHHCAALVSSSAPSTLGLTNGMLLASAENYGRGFASSADEPVADEHWNRIMYPESEARVGFPAPDFTAAAVIDGEFTQVSLSDYKGKFVVLFFYPKDFTFVCPTEIIAFSDRAKEFEKLGAQLLACSTDTEETHLAWIRTPRAKGGLGFMQIPIIADTTKEVAARYGVLIEKAGIALRGLFIINPEGVVEQITINNLPVGRSVDETLRLLQAIQYVREHGEVCPAGWQPGDKTMVATPDGSLDYFSTVAEETVEEEFSTKLTPIKSRKEYDAAVATKKKLIVDFYAPWCGKCRQIGPFIDDLVAKHPDISFMKLDTTGDGLDTLSSELGVKVLPAFRFYQKGQSAGPDVLGYKKKMLLEAVEKLSKA
mmetsp:Transcript_3167/g.5431  ORF Transcript_3167/g.5431 Transcript_3167/m.5431 type:complete len:391 (+) Transcript_3167:51-1223(+)|eukprot:CAMPEP_0119107214 /NCGR_PEP_ID=MMETSP1180-20130426/9540_1 /TAXON_ID=3052 ORGANISM="Chlamydomonas cf sp, Strain CCMP681" /NCGR_SAMPLE_ID=MMETSP1180 /ASSEMBLY_ACC=CAM_ASM_000741 /LENGTH=390 /DNA_ID=CAMNT_0007092671 /DNA_START=50 /DNA_END=1222 /DNA_ORIENTATION=-